MHINKIKAKTRALMRLSSYFGSDITNYQNVIARENSVNDTIGVEKREY